MSLINIYILYLYLYKQADGKEPEDLATEVDEISESMFGLIYPNS